jgi:hypothetical protein
LWRKATEALARHREVALATSLAVGVAFNEHEIAGILDDPAKILLHHFDTGPANVDAAEVQEHVSERRLVGKSWTRSVAPLGRTPPNLKADSRTPPAAWMSRLAASLLGC